MSKPSLSKRRAYVLIEADPGMEPELMRKVKGISRVVNMDMVHGEYDIVAVLEGDWIDIDQSIIAIRKLPGLRKTVTLINVVMDMW